MAEGITELPVFLTSLWQHMTSTCLWSAGPCLRCITPNQYSLHNTWYAQEKNSFLQHSELYLLYLWLICHNKNVQDPSVYSPTQKYNIYSAVKSGWCINLSQQMVSRDRPGKGDSPCPQTTQQSNLCVLLRCTPTLCLTPGESHYTHHWKPQ